MPWLADRKNREVWLVKTILNVKGGNFPKDDARNDEKIWIDERKTWIHKGKI